MAGYNKHIGLFLVIQSLSTFSLLCPGPCHSFFMMKVAGFLSAFAGSMKQSSGLCVPFLFLLQWGHSLSSPLVLHHPPALFPPPVLPHLVAAVIAAARTFFISFSTSVMSCKQKSFNVLAINATPGGWVGFFVAAYAVSRSVASCFTVSWSAEVYVASSFSAATITFG